MAMLKSELRPHDRAGRHAANAAVQPVATNTTTKSRILLNASGKIKSVVRHRPILPQSGWLRLRSASNSLSRSGKALLVTATRTSVRVLGGASCLAGATCAMVLASRAGHLRDARRRKGCPDGV